MTGLVLRVPIKHMGCAVGVVPFVDGAMVEKIARIDNITKEPQYDLVGKNEYYAFCRPHGKYEIKGDRITIYD